jgi:DNA repair exonuclease SbcCD ATPase subunit
MRAVVKEDLKKIKLETYNLQNSISQSKSSLENYKEDLAKAKEKIKTDTSEKIKEVEFEISELSLKKEKSLSVFKEFEKELVDLNKKINTLNEERIKRNSNISELNNKLTLYSKHRCPYCLNDLTSDSSLKTKQIIESKKKEYESLLPSTIESISNIKSLITEKENIISKNKKEYYSFSSKLDLLELELIKLTQNTDSTELSTLASIIERVQLEINQSTSSFNSKQEELSIENELDNILSDDGIKKDILSNIIPLLNSRISDISKKLEFKFEFNFNENFDSTINYLGLTISPESLSTGQRRKMNLIVLLAFIEVIKMKHASMNILFLDEIFSSLDKENVYMTVQILKEYSIKYNITIFAVSNDSLPEELFDSKIIVENQNSFSDLKIQ